MWNERYNTNEYIYGVNPNSFVENNLEYIGKKVLLPADGEGRNSVFLAKNNKEVTCFDGSPVAINKALNLAEINKVTINAIESFAEDFIFEKNYYDSIILCYFHMQPEIRQEIHHKCIEALRPNGTIILEGFDKDQLEYNSGGPKDIVMLFSKKIIEHDFKKLKKIYLANEHVILDEGKYHQGEASVVRFIGKKDKYND